MNPRDVERLLRRHSAPEPSVDLGVSVKSASARSLRAGVELSLPERLWFSRAGRVGWATSLVALIALQLVLPGAAERQTRRALANLAPGMSGTGDSPSRAVAAAREIGLEPTGSLRLIGRPRGRAEGVPGRDFHRLDVLEGAPPAPESPPRELMP